MRIVVNRPEEGQVIYIAVDVSRTKWVAKVRWGGCERRGLSMPGELGHLQALVSEYQGHPVELVYEACGFGYEIAWWAQGCGIKTVVVAPSTVERARGAQVKTDRLDAAKLCEKLEKGDLKSAYVPTRLEHEIRQLSRTYGQAIKERQRAQRRLRSLLQEQGRIGPAPEAGWASYKRWLGEQKLPGAVAVCVKELLQMRKDATAIVQRLKKALLEQARSQRYALVVRALKQQPGIAELGAIRIALEIGDITRFTTAGSFTNYLGLVPSEYSSGDLVHRGNLRKCGPAPVRSWLVQSAWSSIRRGTRSDARLREVYERVHPRAGSKRAIIAVARRLALRVRARWIEALQPQPQEA